MTKIEWRPCSLKQDKTLFNAVSARKKKAMIKKKIRMWEREKGRKIKRAIEEPEGAQIKRTPTYAVEFIHVIGIPYSVPLLF